MTIHEHEFNGLNWVKGEIEESLNQARTALENYVGDPNDITQLRFCATYLHQVRGTLQMIELYGAVLLAEEMELLAQALLNDRVKQRKDAYEVLMRAILQMPNYLDRLQAGRKDIPVVLLPLLNDLRTTRGQNLLSDNVFFKPDLTVAAPPAAADLEVPAGAEDRTFFIRKQRQLYQLALLRWFRNPADREALGKMTEVVANMEPFLKPGSQNQVWWVARGVMDAVSDGGLEVSVSLKSLLGGVDREIRRLMQVDQAEFSAKPAQDLIKNLLFYIGHSTSEAPLVQSIKQAFKLKEIIPDKFEVDEAQSSLLADTTLYETVSAALKEELLKIKDALDLYVRDPNRSLTNLGDMEQNLRQVGDTLGMLGEGILRNKILTQSGEIAKMVAGEKEVSDTDLMNVASALLYVESSLSGLAKQMAKPAKGTAATRRVEGTLPQAEYDNLVQTVLGEALHDIAQIKDAIIGFNDRPDEFQRLENVPALLNQVRGGLTILHIDQPLSLIGNIHSFVTTDLLKQRQDIDKSQIERLADIITSLEYYLETLSEKGAERPEILAFGEHSLASLSRREAAAPAPAPAVEARPYEKGEEIDEEVIGVFIDEAWEEIEKIKRNLATWKANLDDKNSLATLRRAYHTLKGSGRLVAATEVADFAWAIENMLNRVIDGSVTPNANVFNLLDQAAAALPKLVNAFNNQEPSGVDAAGISAIANRLAANTPVEPVAPAEAGAPVTRSELPVKKNNVEPAVSAPAAPQVAAVAEVTPTPAPAAPAHAAPPAELDEEMAEIREVFLEEAAEVMDTLHTNYPIWAANPNDKDTRVIIRRAFHTMKGSGRMAQAADIGEFAWAIEKMLNKAIEGSIETSPTLIEVVQRAIDTLPGMLEAFRNRTTAPAHAQTVANYAEALARGEMPDIEAPVTPEPTAEPSLPEMAEAVAIAEIPEAELPEEAAPEEIVLETPAEPMEFEIAAPGLAAAADEVDLAAYAEPPVEELAGDEGQAPATTTPATALPAVSDLTWIFLEEAAELLAKISGCLQEHRHAPAAGPWLAELKRDLYTLQNSARTAELPSIADLGQAMQSAVAGMADGRITPTVPMLGVLYEACERLQNMVRQINERQIPEPAADLIAAIAAQTERREVSATAEPAFQFTEVVQIFLEEADELLHSIDGTLHAHRHAPEPGPWIDQLQRDLHTLKGSARMAELSAIGNLSHHMESLLEAMNQGRIGVTQELMGFLQSCYDNLHHMVERVQNHLAPSPAMALIAQLEDRLAGKYVAPEEEAPATTIKVELETVMTPATVETAATAPISESFAAFLEEAEELLNNIDSTIQEHLDHPIAGVWIEQLQRDVHTLKGCARRADLTPVSTLSHSLESLLEAMRYRRLPVTPQVLGFLQACYDRLHHFTECVQRQKPLSEAEDLTGQIDEWLAHPELLRPLKAVETEAGEAGESTLVQTAGLLPEVATQITSAAQVVTSDTVRLHADVLDKLVNISAELGIFKSRIAQQLSATRYNVGELDHTIHRIQTHLRTLEIEAETNMHHQSTLYSFETKQHDFDTLEFDRFSQVHQVTRSLMEGLSDLVNIHKLIQNQLRDVEVLIDQQERQQIELHDGLMRTRMVPFSSIVPRLRRLVRQTCDALHKEVELKVEGERVELDRSVLNRVLPALEHLLRNSVDHGIEKPEDRKGKPASGEITIKLQQQGTQVSIELRDDGRGINLDLVKEKAIAKGMMSPTAKLTDQEIMQFIFEAGFSTASALTQISGRGVGLDVVSNEVRELNGTVLVDSQKGLGTRFTIQLPLTLATQHALMVSVSSHTFALPLQGFLGIARLDPTEFERLLAHKAPTFEYAGEKYTLHSLQQMLGFGKYSVGEHAARKIPVLLFRIQEHYVALQVDELQGHYEIVLKPLGPQVRAVPSVAGGTILGDGRVVLVLDMPTLVRSNLARRMIEEELAAPEEKVAEAKRITAMVVDDSITVRKATARLLRKNDIESVSAKDGVDALTLIQQSKPDIILLDIEMPRMDGFELASILRHDERFKDIPIIMITSRTGEKHRNRAEELGVNKYLGKPYNAQELVESIHALVNPK
ncbi:MAG: Hpt domain-containing protein [Pseudomonadota bacterium]